MRLTQGNETMKKLNTFRHAVLNDKLTANSTVDNALSVENARKAVNLDAKLVRNEVVFIILVWLWQHANAMLNGTEKTAPVELASVLTKARIAMHSLFGQALKGHVEGEKSRKSTTVRSTIDKLRKDFLLCGLPDFNAICKECIVKDGKEYTINKQALVDCLYGNGKNDKPMGFITSRKAEIAKVETEKLAQDMIDASLAREKEIQDRIAQALAQHVA